MTEGNAVFSFVEFRRLVLGLGCPRVDVVVVQELDDLETRKGREIVRRNDTAVLVQEVEFGVFGVDVFDIKCGVAGGFVFDEASDFWEGVEAATGAGDDAGTDDFEDFTIFFVGDVVVASVNFGVDDY